MESLYGYITVCLPIHQLKDIYVVSSLWLLQIKLLCILVHRFLCAHFPRVKPRSVIAGLYGKHSSKETAKLFTRVAIPFYILPPAMYKTEG